MYPYFKIMQIKGDARLSPYCYCLEAQALLSAVLTTLAVSKCLHIFNVLILKNLA